MNIVVRIMQSQSYLPPKSRYSTHEHLVPPRFSGKSHPPPCYGPPNLEQIPWLPANFIPCPPPFYFGRPCGPYLPAPLHFNPDIIAALVPYPQQHKVCGDNELEPFEGHKFVNEIEDGGE
jgi:hypothetical protein